MTQPIQEPLTSRRLTSFGYGQNQLFRRPAPGSGAATLPYCYMRWVGSEAVATDTISNPATVGSPDEPYEEGFIYDPDSLALFQLDLDTGCIEWSLPGLYYIWAQAEWNGTSTVGDVLGVILQMGRACSFGTNRTQNSVVATAVSETVPIMVSRMEFSVNPASFGNESVRAMVFHNGAGNDIGAVHIYVVQVNANVDGDFYP